MRFTDVSDDRATGSDDPKASSAALFLLSVCGMRSPDCDLFRLASTRCLRTKVPTSLVRLCTASMASRESTRRDKSCSGTRDSSEGVEVAVGQTVEEIIVHEICGCSFYCCFYGNMDNGTRCQSQPCAYKNTGPANFQFCPVYMYQYAPSLCHEKVKFQFGHFNDLYIFEEYKAVFNYIITAEFCIIADWGGITGINVKIHS